MVRVDEDHPKQTDEREFLLKLDEKQDEIAQNWLVFRRSQIVASEGGETCTADMHRLLPCC